MCDIKGIYELLAVRAAFTPSSFVTLKAKFVQCMPAWNIRPMCHPSSIPNTRFNAPITVCQRWFERMWPWTMELIKYKSMSRSHSVQNSCPTFSKQFGHNSCGVHGVREQSYPLPCEKHEGKLLNCWFPHVDQPQAHRCSCRELFEELAFLPVLPSKCAHDIYHPIRTYSLVQEQHIQPPVAH